MLGGSWSRLYIYHTYIYASCDWVYIYLCVWLSFFEIRVYFCVGCASSVGCFLLMTLNFNCRAREFNNFWWNGINDICMYGLYVCALDMLLINFIILRNHMTVVQLFPEYYIYIVYGFPPSSAACSLYRSDLTQWKRNLFKYETVFGALTTVTIPIALGT